MQEYIPRLSLLDAIEIMQSGIDLKPQNTLSTWLQITNRIPAAHLAIERALKFLLEKSSGYQRSHNLKHQIDALRVQDYSSAAFLDTAFDAATAFYGLNPNRPGLKHLESIDTYLDLVGTETAFEKMRYWELEQRPDEALTQRLFPTLHLEILHALKELYFEDMRRPETIVDRVEWHVRETLFNTVNLGFSSGTAGEVSVKRYIEWVCDHPSWTDALTEAAKTGFSIGDDFMNETVASAYKTLTESSDPAVRYLTEKIDTLPPQPREVVPEVEWLDPGIENTGRVVTPGGTWLGNIWRGLDGSWNVMPSQIWDISPSGRARSQTDARCYLAQELTKPYNLAINGEHRTLRLVGKHTRPFRFNHQHQPVNGDNANSWTHMITCWEKPHGIEINDQIQVDISVIGETGIARGIVGYVAQVEDCDLFIVGNDFFGTPIVPPAIC